MHQKKTKAVQSLALLFPTAQEKRHVVRAIDFKVDTSLPSDQHIEHTFFCADAKQNPLPITLVQCGIGQKNAASMTQLVLEKYRISSVLLCGFAGGLSPTLQTGDVFWPNEIVNQAGQRIAIPCPDFAGPTQRILLTTDQLVGDVSTKASLFEQHHAQAVDMEAYAVAQVANALGTNVQVLRVILDDAAQALPASTQHWVNPQGDVKMTRVMRDVLTKPWMIPHLCKLKHQADVAGVQLAKQVRQMLVQMQCKQVCTLKNARENAIKRNRSGQV